MHHVRRPELTYLSCLLSTLLFRPNSDRPDGRADLPGPDARWSTDRFNY